MLLLALSISVGLNINTFYFQEKNHPQSSWSFLADLKVADNTILKPSTDFEKGWKISLSGIKGRYYLKKYDGIFGPEVIAINEVGPFNRTHVDIYASFKSPDKPGIYVVRYDVIGPSGEVLSGSGRLYLKIIVD